MSRSLHHRAAALLPLVLALGLAACGGAADEAQAPAASTTRPTPLDYTADVTAPLLDDDGSVLPSRPDAVPADHGAHTHSGLYATRTQARMLQSALGEQVLRVQVECCGSEAVDRAVGIAVGLQAAHDLATHTPVLVDAADLRLGAAAANRLAREGFSRVWLVTK
jgi:hypothetical protein